MHAHCCFAICANKYSAWIGILGIVIWPCALVFREPTLVFDRPDVVLKSGFVNLLHSVTQFKIIISLAS
jgi:hypothetical protein